MLPETAMVSDDDVLRWIGRFRFVTAELLAERFGVSVQRARARTCRLEREGLVRRERAHQSEQYAISLTGRGNDIAGFARRPPVRPHVQREHELAIVRLAAAYDRRPSFVVETERECRRREATTDARRSVTVTRVAGRGDRKRWPDLVLANGNDLVALEIEFSPKGTGRLAGIIDAYLQSPVYSRVVWLMSDPATAARLTRIVAEETSRERIVTQLSGTKVLIDAWPHLPAEQARAVTAAINRARAA